MLDRQRSTKEVLLIAWEASAAYAINNTYFVDLCLSSIVVSYHLSNLDHNNYTHTYIYIYIICICACVCICSIMHG